jgi:glycosyltransferase involved in cell wall biosynthesis
MRVLVVASALMPSQLQVWREASEFDDVDLHLAGALKHDVDDFRAPLGVPEWGTCHVLPARDLTGRGRLWWHLEGLEDLIRRVRADLVHVHSEVWGRLVAQALRGNAPVVAHGAENLGLDFGGRVEARIRGAVARHNARRLAGYVSWNRAGVRVLHDAGLPASAPVAVAPAVVPDATPFLAVPPRPASSTVNIGYIGRLVPEKGVQWLVTALDAVPNIRLVVIGSGPYEDELRAQVRRRGIEAQFVGSVPPDEMPRALADLDIVAVPSLARPGWAEQFGRVVCEAMLAAIPVVASDSGALPEVVGDGGIVVPELDHLALHNAITALVDDRAMRVRVGNRGREWALAHFSPGAAARSIRTLWNELAAA